MVMFVYERLKTMYEIAARTFSVRFLYGVSSNRQMISGTNAAKAR
jgi:hypothetical protein